MSKHQSQIKYSKEIEAKLNYLKKETNIKKINIGYDFDNDESDFSLNGVSVFSKDFYYPAAVGFDVGCGFHVVILKKGFKKNLKFWENLFTKELISKNRINVNFNPIKNPVHTLLGVIERGNHFIEVKVISKIHNPYIATQLDLSIDDVCILIHSGSTTEIKEIFVEHFIEFINYTKQFKDIDDTNGFQIKIHKDHPNTQTYLKHINIAQNLAKLNRYNIANKIIEKTRLTENFRFDKNHQYLTWDQPNIFEHHKGSQGYSLIRGIDLAYVAVDKFSTDFLVAGKSNNINIINHGIVLGDHGADKFYNDLFNGVLPYFPVIEMETMCMFKNGVLSWNY